MQLSRIFMGIERTARESGPSLRQQICAQMPRPRSLRPLFDVGSELPPNAIITMQSNGFPGGDIIWKKGAWRGLRTLEQMCSKEVCGRRGCDIPSAAQCAKCKRANYCGAGCQKIDWKEHKLVCGIDIDARDLVPFAELRN